MFGRTTSEEARRFEAAVDRAIAADRPPDRAADADGALAVAAELAALLAPPRELPPPAEARIRAGIRARVAGRAPARRPVPLRPSRRLLAAAAAVALLVAGAVPLGERAVSAGQEVAAFIEDRLAGRAEPVTEGVYRVVPDGQGGYTAVDPETGEPVGPIQPVTGEPDPDAPVAVPAE